MPELQPNLIQMWSGPRNVSTAMMYAFAQREDTEVVDEPFYAVYLRQSGLDHPGRDTVMTAMPEAPEQVAEALKSRPARRPNRFVKQMAHHLRSIDGNFLEQGQHFILTRAPAGVLTSLVNQIPEPAIHDTGYPEQIALLERFPDIPVVDSSLLLRNPEGVLRKLCERLNLDFQQTMLSWPAGSKPYDGVWADWWYENVHRSTGFAAPRKMPDKEEVSENLQALLSQCQPLYDRLAAVAIQPSITIGTDCTEGIA